MAIRKVSFAPDEYYHIYNRGNSKQNIFHDDQDRLRFLELLFLSNTTSRFNTYNIKKDKNIFEHNREILLTSIGAYTLMSNHFHILVKHKDGGDISKFMQKLSTGYSMYYNQKYKRSGSLFEGKFKSSHIANDRYLRYIFSYIHLNCIKLIDPSWKERGVKNKNKSIHQIKTYKWSSGLDYFGPKRKDLALILDKKAFPNYFSSQKSMRDDLFDWLKG